MTLRNKFNLSLVIFILLSVILILFIIYPLFKEIKINSEDLISKKQNLTLLERKIENLKQYQTLWGQIEPNLEKIDKLFIDPEVPVEFISFLEETARDCDLSVEISPFPASKITEDPWSSLLFQIRTTASFSKFSKFLEKLETSPYLIKIQNLNVKRLTEKDLEQKAFEKFSLGDTINTLLIKVYTQ
jgi:Tfp pilus assembly protein PilO